MDIERVLNSIKHFLEVDDWAYFHLKADSPTGQRREMIMTNAPVDSEPRPMLTDIGPKETPEDKFKRIFTAIKQDQMPQGDDEEYWKDIQSKLALNGTRPQVQKGDSLEVALGKVREAGII